MAPYTTMSLSERLLIPTLHTVVGCCMTVACSAIVIAILGQYPTSLPTVILRDAYFRHLITRRDAEASFYRDTIHLGWCAVSGKALTEAKENLFNVRRQDLSPDVLKSIHQFRAVLFISHRWESRFVPDPTNRQRDYVVTVLRAAWSDPSSPLITNIELRKPGGRLSLVEYASRCRNWEEFIKNVGVWYDHCCVIQPSSDDGILSEEEDKVQTAELRSLPDIISSSTALLIDDVEDYYCSAWCVTEAVVARDSGIALLRHQNSTGDRVGHSVHETALNVAALWKRIANLELVTRYHEEPAKIGDTAQRAFLLLSPDGMDQAASTYWGSTASLLIALAAPLIVVSSYWYSRNAVVVFLVLGGVVCVFATTAIPLYLESTLVLDEHQHGMLSDNVRHDLTLSPVASLRFCFQRSVSEVVSGMSAQSPEASVWTQVITHHSARAVRDAFWSLVPPWVIFTTCAVLNIEPPKFAGVVLVGYMFHCYSNFTTTFKRRGRLYSALRVSNKRLEAIVEDHTDLVHDGEMPDTDIRRQWLRAFARRETNFPSVAVRQAFDRLRAKEIDPLCDDNNDQRFLDQHDVEEPSIPWIAKWLYTYHLVMFTAVVFAAMTRVRM